MGDDPAYKKKAEAEARWEAEGARIRREIEEMDAEGEALSSRLGDDAAGVMNGEPPYDDDEPDEDWRSAYPEVDSEGVPEVSRQEQQTTQRKLGLRTRAESRDLPPPVYLIQDLIEVGADAVIYGDSRKSQILLCAGNGRLPGDRNPGFWKV